jgi:hypothetical protein
MKKSITITFNKLLLALLILISVNITVFLINDSLLIKTVLPLFIPIFLIFHFMKNKKLSIVFISFLIFSFLGDASTLFFSEEIIIKTSSILYFLSYMYLIIMIAPKFKFFELDRLIAAYLIGVFSITIYFLNVFYDIVNAVLPDSNEVLLFGLKSLILVLLAFISFGVYLNTQSKQSAIFLTAVICFVFSVILNYINIYYLYNLNFLLVERMLYVVGLYLLFKYIAEENTNKKQVEIRNKVYTSDNVLA